MKIIRTFLFLSFIIFSTYVNGQDELLFYNGKVLVGKVIEVDSLDIKFEKKGKKKIKKMFVGKDRVFAIQYKTGKTKILYEPIADSEDLPISEMELFVRGAHDARNSYNTYKTPWPFIGGVIVGSASVLLLPVPIFFAFIPILPYAIIIGKVNPKIKDEMVSDLSLLKNDAYILGFKDKAKNINIQNAIKGSLIGFIGGVLIHPFVYPVPTN